jgi:hypothetical protein
MQYLRYKADNGQSCVAGDILKSISLFTLIISLVLLVMYGTSIFSHTCMHIPCTDFRTLTYAHARPLSLSLSLSLSLLFGCGRGVQDLLLCFQTGHVDVQPCITVDGVYG